MNDKAVTWETWRRAGRPTGVHAVSLADVRAAQKRIAGHAVRTPLKPAPALTERLGVPTLLKMETMQPTGAFKVRGAANRLLALDPASRARGVITASTGNHGVAVAYLARQLGIRCVVSLSSLVPPDKVAAIAALDAELDVGGADQDAAMQRAKERAAREGLILVSPFDDPWVIAGQGTIGAEILEDLPQVATIVMPLSGGGLAGGIAVAAKAINPSVRIVAVGSARCPAMLRSLQAGHPVRVTEQPSLTDSLGGGIDLENRYSFTLVQDLVDDVELADEVEIIEALRFAFFRLRLVLEGAAATPIAALLRRSPGGVAGPVVAVVTGDNVDTVALCHILAGERPIWGFG